MKAVMEISTASNDSYNMGANPAAAASDAGVPPVSFTISDSPAGTAISITASPSHPQHSPHGEFEMRWWGINE